MITYFLKFSVTLVRGDRTARNHNHHSNRVVMSEQYLTCLCFHSKLNVSVNYNPHLKINKYITGSQDVSFFLQKR